MVPLVVLTRFRPTRWSFEDTYPTPSISKFALDGLNPVKFESILNGKASILRRGALAAVVIVGGGLVCMFPRTNCAMYGLFKPYFSYGYAAGCSTEKVGRADSVTPAVKPTLSLMFFVTPCSWMAS
jgi:hypothetical protein